MNSPEASDERREQSRAASPLPEEETAGIDDPNAQAAAIIEDSDERQDDRDASPGSIVEHRTSSEATPPPD